MRIGRAFGLAHTSMMTSALAAVTMMGCAAPDTLTVLKPEGAPVMLQVFVTEEVGDATAIDTYFNSNDGIRDDDANGCPDDFEEAGADCAVTAAVTNGGQKIRIVLDELLDGQTVEEFFCACAVPAVGDADCPNNILASLDPTMCGNNPNTQADEAGRWADNNADGVPDRSRMLPGVVVINCGGATPAYTSTSDDGGFYNPSGNQQVPSGFDAAFNIVPDLSKLGPALVALPPALPTSSMCSVSVASTVKDKDGESVPAHETATFATVALRVDASVPSAGATAVSRANNLTVTFNSTIDAATITGVTLTQGANAVAATVALSAMDPSTIEIDPAADLAATTAFTITIPAAVGDSFGGGTLGTAQTITFTTGM